MTIEIGSGESGVKYSGAQKGKSAGPRHGPATFSNHDAEGAPGPSHLGTGDPTLNLDIAIIAIRCRMRSVNVAELKNQLSKYLTFARSGEEIVIRDRNLPVAKLIPFSAGDASDEELLLVAAGKMRLPKDSADLEKLLKVPSGRSIGREVTGALLKEREQSR